MPTEEEEDFETDDDHFFHILSSLLTLPCVIYAGEKHFKMIQEFSLQVNGTKVIVVVKTDINPAYLMKGTSQ